MKRIEVNGVVFRSAHFYALSIPRIREAIYVYVFVHFLYIYI